ncbi:hypothetical protein X474_26150 [Dethiosulfatarculus sandiegensis]|uniref:Uncharacterized protein n=1 Tax=Dethiosulfatarculus sandiegensis TaxID=1429043 RepID=A0A0D2J6E8_9BACT|nr:hypothetical protein X474_26150 [Dethiosulfatarculus sandiegensis]
MWEFKWYFHHLVIQSSIYLQKQLPRPAVQACMATGGCLPEINIFYSARTEPLTQEGLSRVFVPI